MTHMTSLWSASVAVEVAGEAFGDHEQSMFALVIAAVCGVWALAVLLVQVVGFTQLYAT